MRNLLICLNDQQIQFMWGDDIKNALQQNETILGQINSFIDGLILWQNEPEISKYIDKKDYINGLYFQFYGG